MLPFQRPQWPVSGYIRVIYLRTRLVPLAIGEVVVAAFLAAVAQAAGIKMEKLVK